MVPVKYGSLPNSLKKVLLFMSNLCVILSLIVFTKKEVYSSLFISNIFFQFHYLHIFYSAIP